MYAGGIQAARGGAGRRADGGGDRALYARAHDAGRDPVAWLLHGRRRAGAPRVSAMTRLEVRLECRR